MANISQKVNLTANQRMDIAEFMAIQTNLENAVTRLVQLIGSPIVDPVTNIQWNVNGVLTSSSITVSGADLIIGSGLEVMCKDGHIITQDANYTMTGVLPLGATKALMAKPLAEAQALPDNRRFWDNGTTQEVNGTPNTILTRQLDFAFVSNTAADIEDAVNNSDYVFIATVSSDGSTVVWKNAFPDSGTLELPSLLAVVKRMIGRLNENSGQDSASCGGVGNTNSGKYSTSSGGYSNTNSGDYSASLGGNGHVNSGQYSSSAGGWNNNNTGAASASLGGTATTNSGSYTSSCGSAGVTNSGDYTSSLGGRNHTNIGDYSVSIGGGYNVQTAAAIRGISLGGQHNQNSGIQSTILGQYCENATDDVICGGYNTTLTPSGANQNLKWILSNRYGTAHFASDVKIGGNVNDGTGATFMVLGTSGSFQAEGNAYFGGDVDLTADPKAKIIGATGKAHIGGDVEIGGTVTAGATASTAPTVKIWSAGSIQAQANGYFGGDIATATDPKIKFIGSTGATHIGGDIEIGGTVKLSGPSTAPTIKITAAGVIHSEGNINVGGEVDDGTNKKAQIVAATGEIRHLGQLSQKAGALTGTATSTGGTHVEDLVTLSGAWPAGLPVYQVTITIDNTGNPDWDAGDSVYFTAPPGTIVSTQVHFDSTTTADADKIRWGCMTKTVGATEQVNVFNAGGDMGAVGAGNIVITVYLYSINLITAV